MPPNKSEASNNITALYKFDIEFIFGKGNLVLQIDLGENSQITIFSE